MRARESLAQRQRRLLVAVKGRGGDTTGFGERELALLRETLLWWRRLGVTQACRLTATLLGAQGRLDATIESFVRDTHGADSVETQRDLFLTHVAHHAEDRLCAAVAATELALFARLAKPGTLPRAIAWPRDPGPVLAALLRGRDPPDGADQPFIVLVGAEGGGGLEWHPGHPGSRAI